VLQDRLWGACGWGGRGGEKTILFSLLEIQLRVSRQFNSFECDVRVALPLCFFLACFIDIHLIQPTIYLSILSYLILSYSFL
jgi:hypothetical protein